MSNPAEMSNNMPREEIEVVRHHLQTAADGSLVNQDGVPFDLRTYSKMKFGSLDAARDMGLEMGEFLLESAPDFMLNEAPICAPFMYRHIPSAAHTIARYAFARINAERAHEGLDRVHTRQLYIGHQPKDDYSKLSHTDRARYFRESNLRLITDSLDGFNLMLLDDIKITGTYENIVRDLTRPYDIACAMHAYWAVVDPEEAANNPAIENMINSSAGSDLSLIQEIIDEGELEPTLRTIKLVLAHEDQAELRHFLSGIPSSVLLKLYESAAGAGADIKKRYEDNYIMLEELALNSEGMQRARQRAQSANLMGPSALSATIV